MFPLLGIAISLVALAVNLYCCRSLDGIQRRTEQLSANTDALVDAARAGALYSNALRRLQDEGKSGQVVPGTDELDRLFMDWHDKTHAALALIEGAK
jgi:hypothetical protein